MSKNLSALLRTGSSTPLTIASNTILGGVKVDGETITINSSGVISGANTYSLPTASSSDLGGVIIPVVGTSGITNTSGTIGIATASASQLGGVKVNGNNIAIDGNGVISVVEKTTTLSSTATTLTIDLTTTTTSTIIITCDTTANQAKVFNFTGTPSTMVNTNIFSINVIVRNNVAIASLAWQRAGAASNIKWPNGAIPPATLTVIGTGGYDVWTFFTTDGGTTFAGSLAMYGVR
jgi:hypothetical protein